MVHNLEFDQIETKADGNIILILESNKSPIYVEAFEAGLIKRGAGEIVRDVMNGDIRYIYFSNKTNRGNL